MVKNKCVFVLFFFLVVDFSFAQQQTYLVRFNDKASNTFSISSPGDFLTARAIQRRQKCKVDVDQKDLPVSQTYIDQVASAGAQIIYPLKWLNGVVVRSDAVVKNQLSMLPFVMSTDHSVKFRTANPSAAQEFLSWQKTAHCLNDYSYRQNDMLGMIAMKNDGYDGSGILIGITDDGFLHADTMRAFEDLFIGNRIIDTWDIVDSDKDAYSQGGGHGTEVFSILAGNITGQLSGPGKGASFILFRTEDSNSESPLEELNWIRAAELADSMGADMLQVSLGYNTFDDPSLDYTESELDGKTSYISQGANIASTRGIVVVVSAGNGGNSSWNKILCPSDAKGILSVGAVDVNEQRASFSSIGYSADGRVKPDVMAMGAGVAYANVSTGNVSFGSGTSFASPLITGLSAGLMQAFPMLTHEELIRAVKFSADRYHDPNPYYGYGIPNYKKASDFARLLLDKDNELVFPNPFHDQLYVKIKGDEIGRLLQWTLYSTTGQPIEEGEVITDSDIVNLFSIGEGLPFGMYCLKVSYNGRFSTFKVVK